MYQALSLTVFFLAMTTTTEAQNPAGTPSDKLQIIPRTIQQPIDAGELAGAVTLVAKDGKIIEFDALGKSDLSTGRPQKTDDFFWVASMTKPITAAAVMMLVDEHKLHLDDPVAKYLPAFKTLWMIAEQSHDHMLLKRPAHSVTIRHLLTHTHGLSEIPTPAAGTPLEEWVNEIARGPLSFEPGSQWKYGNASSNVLGRIVEVVSGMPYQDFLQHRIFDPLGMKETTFYPTEDQLSRLSKSYRLLPDGKGLEEIGISLLKGEVTGRQRTVTPGAGLFATAMDMWRFYQILLDGGVHDGQRLLSAEAVAEMTRVQTGTLETGFSPGMGWGLSLGIVREPTGWTDALPIGAYGHDGAYGTTVIVEPAQRVVMIMMIQLGERNPFADGLKYRQMFQRAVREALSAPGN